MYENVHASVKWRIRMPEFSTLVPAGLHHPSIRQYLAIKNTKNTTHTYAEDLVSIEGQRILTKALKTKLAVHALFVCPQLLRGESAYAMVKAIIASGVPSFLVSEKVLCGMTEWDGPDGLAAIVRLPCFCLQDIQLGQHNALLVLDGLQIPGNVGTIIRCADGAGADGIIITNKRQRLTHPKLLRASMGSLFSFPVIDVNASEAITWLKRHQFAIVTTETNAELGYRSASYRGRVAVVMGNEHSGISQEWHQAQDMSVSIPMNRSGYADSLNVGNAAVLMLYEMLYHQNRLQCS